MTLIEVMVASFLLAGVMLGILATFIQSRRSTEAAILQAATSSFVYGIVEQLKTIPYKPSTATEANSLPAVTAGDATFPAGGTTQQPSANLPYIRVRINQDEYFWLQVVYTQAPTAPAAPVNVPAVSTAAATIGAKDNFVKVRISDTQTLTVNFWVWVDEIPDPTKDVLDVKKITLIYTYTFNDAGRQRLIRDREVIIRTKFQN